MDAITYDSDKFGCCTDDKVRKFRKSFVKDWKKIADGKSSNETIFKYTVTLLDNLENIVTHNSRERQAIIQAFKKRGISKLADGRRIEEIVF